MAILPIVNAPSSHPKLQYLSDSSLQPFLHNDFDPAEFLNRSLPSLAGSSARAIQQSRNPRPVPLSDLNSQLQTLLSQISAQTTRLSDVLTQLSDEIVRSGSRLAYEVEVLAADTVTLEDTVEITLKKDIDLFTSSKLNSAADTQILPEAGRDSECDTKGAKDHGNSGTLERLKSLHVVRSRLDSVIKIFGEAMAWPIAPSEASIGGSFISVSAPGNGAGDVRIREEKGKEYVENLRSEINGLLGDGRDTAGVELALRRVEELRDLAEVWKGTAEEKARLKLVDSLQKPIEERQRALERVANNRKQGISPARGMDYRYGGLI